MLWCSIGAAGYRRTRKDAAAGVDGVTAAQYEAELEAKARRLAPLSLVAIFQ